MSVRQAREFVPEREDPTPGTPFLRSDCTGECEGLKGLSSTHIHRHGHGHSHSHKAVPKPKVETPSSTVRFASPLRKFSASKFMEKVSSGANSLSKPARKSVLKSASSVREIIISAESEEKSVTRSSSSALSSSKKQENHENLSRTPNLRRSTRNQPENPLTPEDMERLKTFQESHLKSPNRTDYTYSYSGAYRAKPPTPEWQPPSMARRPLHGSVHFISTASNGFKYFAVWLGEFLRQKTRTSTTETIEMNSYEDLYAGNPSISVPKIVEPMSNGHHKTACVEGMDTEEAGVSCNWPVNVQIVSEALNSLVQLFLNLLLMISTIFLFIPSKIVHALTAGISYFRSEDSSRAKRSDLAESRPKRSIRSRRGALTYNQLSNYNSVLSQINREESEGSSVDEDIVSNHEERERKGGFLSSWCCWWLLPLLLLLLLLLLGASSKEGKEVVRIYILPLPFIIVNHTREIIRSTSAALTPNFPPPSINVEKPPIVPVAAPPPPPPPQIIEKVTYVQGDVTKEDLARIQKAIQGLEASLAALGQKCDEKPDLSVYATRRDLDQFHASISQQELSLTRSKEAIDALKKETATESPLVGKLKSQETEISELWAKYQSLKSMVAIVDEKASAPPPPPPPAPAPTAPPVVISGGGGVSLEEVNAAVNAAILKYDQDKTGLPDFALEPAGGSVLSTRCSESYTPRTRKESFLGIPLWYMSYSPRVTIQPGVVPGECWAFKGSQGFLVIQLNGLIDISHVSYEHIPKSLSPDGHIESAPKELEIAGLQSEKDMDGKVIGLFKYDDEGPALQTFAVDSGKPSKFRIIEIRIKSNYGHPVYTCLYRFRVHGTRVSPAYGQEPGGN